jgi:iron complex transport system substrate-binding protein
MMIPERIVCLAAEIPDMLWRLGALDRVVGISAYTAGPPEALHLPKATGFRYGSVDRVLALRPDLVILTSDVQRELAAGLGEAGVTTLHFHPHRLDDVYVQMELLGSLVGAGKRAKEICDGLRAQAEDVKRQAAGLSWRPRVYFEEWMDPLICGTGWVSDLIELAGGRDVFRELAVTGRKAQARIVAPEDVAAAEPDLVLASWCGKPFVQEEVEGRPAMREVRAVRLGEIHEVAAPILQCGPALMDALWEVHQRIADFVLRHRPEAGRAFADDRQGSEMMPD